MDGPSRVLVKNLVHIYEKKTYKQPEASSEHGDRIQLKFNEVVSSMGRTEDILSILHRQDKISDRERSDIDQLQSIPLRAKEELLVLLRAKPRDVYEAFLDALAATGQQHVVQLLVSEIEISHKETSAHAGLIVRQYNWLSDNINPDNSLIVALYRNDVLTKREREQLDSEANRLRRSQLLLAILSKKTDDEFNRFLSGLEETNQVKVVNRFKGVDVADGDVASCLDRQEGGLPCTSSPAAVGSVRPSNSELHTRTVPKPLSLAQKPSPLTAKPSILSPKPQRSASAAAASSYPRMATTEGSAAGEHVPPSPTVVLSPTRRALPNIERQLSNPSSSVFHEISLKVASLRQSCTDVEDEIKRKKHQECVQLNRDQQGDGKTKEIARLTSKSVEQNSERTRNASKSSTSVFGEDIRTGSPVTTITTATAASSKPSKHDELSGQLRSSLKENEELRTQLSEFSSRQRSLEAELQKLRNDHEVKVKESSGQFEKLRLQLEEKVVQMKEMEKCKGELDKTRIELTKEIEVSRGREKLLIESKAKLHELEAKNEDLENGLKRVQLQSENQNAQAKSQESSEYEKLLSESKERIYSLEMQLQQKELEDTRNLSSLQTQVEDAKRQNRDKISNLEKQLENDELTANRKISELENKLQESERNLNRLIEEESREHSAKVNSEKSTSELQAQLTSAQEKISDLTEQLYERTTAQANKANADGDELSRLKSQLDRERELGRERESLLVESLEKNSDLLRQMGLTSERLREEEQEKSKVLENVQAELAVERKLTQKQQKDLVDLKEAFDRVNARLRETEIHLHDEDNTKHELDRLLSELNSEKQHRLSLELALKDERNKAFTLQGEIDAKEKLLGEKTQESEVLEDLMSQLTEEKLLRIEVDKRLFDADEEIVTLKQRSQDHEKLLHKANKEKETLNQRLAELDKDTHTKATLEKLITEANEQNEFLQKRCEQQQTLLQRAEEEQRTNAIRLQETKNEAAGLRLNSEQRIQETEQELHRLKQHSDNQKTLLQQAYEEKNSLMTKLTQFGNENQTRNELTERLAKANEEISSLRRQNDDQKKVLERQTRDGEELRGIVTRFQQEHDANAELRKKLKDTESKLSELSAQLQENNDQMEEFKEQELEITQLLQDINTEKRLRYEQQQKLDDAKGTIAILNQRLETLESESKLRLTEYSNTEGPSNDHRLAAATQQLQELSRELKERDAELWRIKKELAKERLLKKDVEKSLAVSENRAQDANRGVRGHSRTGGDGDTPAARNASYLRIATDSTDGGAASQDPDPDALLCVVNTGPPLNVRLNVERPKRKKNHVVRSRAGILARDAATTPLANGSCADDDGDDDRSQPPRLRPRTSGGHDGRTRPDSMGGESMV